MSKTKSLAEQLDELQAARERALEYDKLFDKAFYMNFNMNVAELKRKLASGSAESAFERKLRSYYNLNDDAACARFAALICSAEVKDYLENLLEQKRPAGAEQAR